MISRTGDTHNLLGWDEALGQYVAYPRAAARVGGGVVRLVGRSVSDDFVHWSAPEVVFAPDAADPPSLEIYGMSVFKHEGLYLGLPWTFHTYPEEALSRGGGTIDVQLAASRDGRRWERVGDRQPFIPLGPPGSVDCGMIFNREGAGRRWRRAVVLLRRLRRRARGGSAYRHDLPGQAAAGRVRVARRRRVGWDGAHQALRLRR